MSSEYQVLQLLEAVSVVKEASISGTLAGAAGKVLPYLRGVPGRTVDGARSFTKNFKETGGLQRLGGRAAGMAGTSALGAGAGYVSGDTPEEKKRRAIGGAVIGGAAGLIPGQFLSRAGRQQAERFGQRQVYSLTGIAPKGSRTGYATADKLNPNTGDAVKDRLTTARTLGYSDSPDMEKAIQKGIHTVPGFLKGVVTQPVDTLRHGAVAFGKPGAVLGLGAMGLGVPGAIKNTSESGRAENIGRLAGETVGYIGGMPVPIVGNMALGAGLGQVGGAAGRAFGRLTGIGDKRPALEPIRRG
jgi:hypothetical protein